MSDLKAGEPCRVLHGDKIIGSGTFICDLPPGEWRLASLGDAVVAVCADHKPRMIYSDGTVHIVDSTAGGTPCHS